MPPNATVSGKFKRGTICCNLTLFQLCHPSRILNETLLKKVRRILISKSLTVDPLISVDPNCKDGDYP